MHTIEKTSNETPRWYALHTRYQHEHGVARALETRGIEALLPTFISIRKWKDRNKKICAPLFPGYLFCQQATEHRLAILSTPGVCAILSVAGVPATVAQEEIEAIQRLIQDPGRIEPHPFLRKGTPVRVKAGPFEGIEGYLVRKKDAVRLVVSVQMLGKSASVEIDASAVEPISRAGAVPETCPTWRGTEPLSSNNRIEFSQAVKPIELNQLA